MKTFLLIIVAISLQRGLTAQNGNYADVNGASIYYETHGQGDPLVLLHIITGSHKLWEPWIEGLSQDFRLIIPDLRGHGNSTNPSNKFRHKDAAMDIYALMDHLDIEKFRAIGASSGGMTLLHMATMDSTRITSMILVDAAHYNPDPNRALQKSRTFESYSQGELEWLREHQPKGDAQIKLLTDQFRELSTVYDDMNFTPPYLSIIKCPTLIIHGDNDEAFPVEMAFEMYKYIPNARLWVIPNGGHLPIWKDLWTEQFLKVSKHFFANKL